MSVLSLDLPKIGHSGDLRDTLYALFAETGPMVWTSCNAAIQNRVHPYLVQSGQCRSKFMVSGGSWNYLACPAQTFPWDSGWNLFIGKCDGGDVYRVVDAFAYV
eukprot:scaffold291105_cov46-Prasinocladus_malaysianus.AAC.1